MSQNQPDEPPVEPAEPPASTYGRVAVRTDGAGGPVAHRPGQFLALGDESTDRRRALAVLGGVRPDRCRIARVRTLADGQIPRRLASVRGRLRSVDVLALVRGLRLRGIVVQPNHVYFVTSLGAQAVQFTPNMFAPNMFAPNMFAPNMFAPNMFAPNMFAPNMFAPNMFAGGGAGGGGCCCPPGPIDVESIVVPKLAARPTGAQPAFDSVLEKAVAGTHVDVHVIDVADPGPPASQTHADG